VGGGILVGQIALDLLQSALPIIDTGLVKLLAFILLTPVIYFSYWINVRYVEKHDLTELGRANAFPEFRLGSMIGFALFGSIIATLLLLIGVLSNVFVSAGATFFCAITLQAGILLSAAYELTRRLWMALGLHTM
jgi:hypothetical protein